MKIHHQSVFEKWPLEDESVQLITTSPPYYWVRNYAIEDIIIGGKKDCVHIFEPFGEFKKIGAGEYVHGVSSTLHSKAKKSQVSISDGGGSYLCLKCNAFKGQYGLEGASINHEYNHSYVDHTLLWLEEAFRVLKKGGVLFLNVDDKYGKEGSMLLIPEMIKIRMRELGFVIRNTIAWIRTMPEPHKNRFSSMYEPIIFAVKPAKKNIYWNNSRTGKWVDKEPQPEYIWMNNKIGEESTIEPVDFGNRYASPDGIERSLWRRKNLWEGFNYFFNLDAVRENIKFISVKRCMGNFGSEKMKGDYEAYSVNNRNAYASKVLRQLGIKKESNSKYRKEEAKQMLGGRHGPRGGLNSIESSYIRKLENNTIALKNPGNIWIDYYLSSVKEVISVLGVDGYVESLRADILSKSDILPPLVENVHEKHYAPFSSKLIERLVACGSRVGDVVLDPFAGSGTTLLVAERMNRKGIGIDLGYSEIQERRLKKVKKHISEIIKGDKWQ